MNPGRVFIMMLELVRRSWMWFRARLDRPAALWWFGTYIFLISSLLPLPSEAAIVVMALGNRARPFAVFVVAVVAAALGATLGYLFAVPFSSLIPSLVPPSYDTLLHTLTFVTIFVSSVVPVPHQPFVIVAGLLKAPFWTFFAAFVLGRAVHFAVVIWILAAARRAAARIAARAARRNSAV